MNKFKLMSVLFFVSIFMMTVVAMPLNAAPKKVKLEYKYKMGDSLTYNIAIDGETTMIASGKTASQKVDVKMSFNQKVLHVSKDGKIDIQMTITNAKASSPDGKAVDLTQQIGKTVYTTMSPNGKVLGMTSYDQNFDPNGMSVPFPDEEIGIGKTWTQHKKADAKNPIPMDVKYTLEAFKTVYKGQKRKVAVIAEDIKIPDSEKKKGIVARAKGKLYFDYEKGLIISNNLRTQMIMIQNLRNDDPKFGPPTKKVTTKIKMTTKMELAE